MYEKEILSLKGKSLFRVVRDRQSPQGSRIILDGKEFINFASNDYLGLANNQEVIEAAIEALKRYGSGSGASRLLSGGSIIHRRLEEKIALFKGSEDSLLFNSGYAANTGVISAIADEGDLIISDELNHASIIDGCRLSKARVMIYRHRDIGHLKEIILEEHQKVKGKVVIITDSVFSMDGDIAPIHDIYNLCLDLNESRQNRPVLLYIDDAHGTGVIGNGKGILKHFGLENKEWIIQMGTFSKALGSFGAFVTASRSIIDWLRNKARSFIFSTALPAHIAASSLKALEILERDEDPIKRLWSNRERLIRGLKDIGLDISSETPIVPIMLDDIDEALNLSKHLEEKGIYVPAIRPPTVKRPRLRITITASHLEEEIDSLIVALKSATKIKIRRRPTFP